MLKSFVLAAALAGVLPAAVAQTAFTVNGQFVSVEEQKQLMDFLRANGVTNEKQLKNAARSILLEQKIIEQAARNESLLEDPRVRVLISEKQAQLYGSILSRRYASEHPITEEQVRNRYDSLLSSYDPHEIKFRHILVKTPEEAREIIQSLKVGSDFGSLAKERSLDQSTSQNGGQIPFTNIRNVLVPASPKPSSLFSRATFCRFLSKASSDITWCFSKKNVRSPFLLMKKLSQKCFQNLKDFRQQSS